jgi:hypothetical protein
LWELGGICKLDLFAQYLSQAALHTSMESGSRCGHRRGASRLLDRSTEASDDSPVPWERNPCASPSKIIAPTYHRINLACNARDLRSAIISPTMPHRSRTGRPPRVVCPALPLTAQERRVRHGVGCECPRWPVRQRSFHPADRSRRKRRWPASPRWKPSPGEC